MGADFDSTLVVSGWISLVLPSSGHTFPLKPHEAPHVVDEIDHADLGFRPGLADGADDSGHRPLLVGEDMLDLGAHHGFESIGLAGSVRHRLALGLFAMDLRDEAVLRHKRLVLFRAIGRVGPDAARRIGLVE
jgi:hypothetical protein